jgi:hypothetical protein
MPTLNRQDERELMVDGFLVAAIEFAKSKDNTLDDASAKRLFLKRMSRLGTQRAMRSVESKYSQPLRHNPNG